MKFTQEMLESLIRTVGASPDEGVANAIVNLKDLFDYSTAAEAKYTELEEKYNNDTGKLRSELNNATLNLSRYVTAHGSNVTKDKLQPEQEEGEFTKIFRQVTGGV